MATASSNIAGQKYQHISVRPAAGNIGAYIDGIDTRESLNAEVVSEIRRALLEYLVIFFRDQDITPEQHKNFGRHFGELHIHPYIPALEGHPELLELRSEETGPAEMSYQSNQWHTDLTFLEEPAMACLLWCKQAAVIGGDTMFLNLYRSYETLSERMRKFVDELTAVHDITTSMPSDFLQQSWAPKQLERLQEKTPPVEHPVVRTHPETGRKCLFVNPNFTSHIVGLSRHESDGLLNVLYEHNAKPENVVRFNWETHSMAFWDNRCTQHYAVNDYRSLRVMHRLTLCGDKPY
jgi:taurine dioxygenase